MENQILRELGYTEREIRVYEALLSLGKSTAGPISSKAKLSHTKVYDTLQRLVDRGLVSFITISKTKYYLAEDPKEILNIFDEKRNKIKNIVKEYSLKKKFSEVKQEAIVHEGFNAIKAFFNSLYQNLKKGDFYYGFALREKYKESFPPLILINFHNKIAGKKIDDKIIANTNFKKEVLNSYKGNSNIKLRFLKQVTPVGIAIVKDKVIQVIWSDLPTAIEITSPQLHKYYKEYFEEMWKIAKK
ncbi:hypothetical protein GOV12_01720 [Candidatus Pacearchaeota archaeon]|nr:hypothetical protein [Candidatus Pacearchaeota archaeon]